MKKILTVLLACVSLLICVFMGVGCSSVKPQLDLRDAAEALEENGYDVDIEDDMDYGYYDVIIEGYLEAEEEDGDEWIEIYEFESASIAKAYYKKLKQEYEAYIDRIKAEIRFLKKILKMYDDELKSGEIDDIEDELKEMEEYLEEQEEEWEASGYSGKYVWTASSERALKDTK